jgi:uncharacterized membrane protein
MVPPTSLREVIAVALWILGAYTLADGIDRPRSVVVIVAGAVLIVAGALVIWLESGRHED